MVACSKETITENDIVNFIKEYKTAQYTIQSPTNIPTTEEIEEKVKPFLTKKEFEKQMANRVFEIAPMIAEEMNKSIEISDVILEKDSENDNGSIEAIRSNSY